MADWEFVKQATVNPLVSIRFRSEPDLFLVFCADVNEQNALRGVTLWGLRKSRGPNPYPLKEDLVPTIFQPTLTQKSDREFMLKLEPLADAITLLRKGNQFICMYPFKEVGKVGHVVDVVVDYTLNPISMEFTVEGQFKASKEGPIQKLTSTVKCPSEFTNRLYAFFKSD